MAALTPLTIDIDEDIKAGLEQLATSAHVSAASLASEAIAAYVEQELEAVRGIEAALSDIKNGNVVPHDDAMKEILGLINAAQAKHT